jgi:dTDP-4-dehydrorhamnose 3,5-epimerase
MRSLIRCKNRLDDFFLKPIDPFASLDEQSDSFSSQSILGAQSFVEKIKTALLGVLELRPKVFRDVRGSFVETYHRDRFAEAGIHEIFVQDNHSRSTKGTLRGFHYQLNRPQAKLCWVAEGEALDVALDVRAGSPHFGKWASVRLSAAAQNQIFIPAGFAHAFLALTETVQFIYKCSEFYDPKSEHGVLWNDRQVGVKWEIENPIISDKDAKFSRLTDIPNEFLPRYESK